MIALALLMMQTGAPAPAPAYLTCTLPGQDGASVFDVQLNEAANTATYSFEFNGVARTVTSRAAFSAAQVSFNTFSINRTDLTFQRDNRNSPFYGISKNMAPVDIGTCVINAAKRAF